MRRAALPLAYTQGFTPHPRLAFAAPLALGASGANELMDAYFTEQLPLDELRARLADQLPAACRVASLHTVPMEAPSLMASLRWAEYRVECTESLPDDVAEPLEAASPAQGSRWSRHDQATTTLPPPADPATLASLGAPWRPPSQVLPPLPNPLPLPSADHVQQRIDTLLAADHIPHTRHRDGKTTTHDLRPLLLDLWLASPADSSLVTRHSSLSLGLLLRADSSGAGRPDDLAAALGLRPHRIHRLRLGIADERPCRSDEPSDL